MQYPTTLLLIASCALSSSPATQESKALFEAPVVLLDAWSRMDRVLDVDLDGDVDAVGVWTHKFERTRAEFAAYLNDGSGDLGTRLVVDTLTIPWEAPNVLKVVVGDWTGDGNEDVALAGPNLLVAYRTYGAAIPLRWSRLTTTHTPIRAVAADVDADGHDDIALLTSNSVQLYRATATGLVYSGSWPAGGDDLIATEIDGDAAGDFALIQGTAVQLLRFDGTSLADAGRLVHGVPSEQMPVSGDIDGDGDTDLVVFGPAAYAVLRRTGPATFQVEPARAGGPATGLADIDGDGDLDGVCCGGGGGQQPTTANTGRALFHVSSNDGTGRFAAAWTIPNLGARELAGAVDVDGDGDTDLVAGRCVFYNQESFTVVVQPELDNAFGNRWPRIADVDADGDPDLDFVVSGYARNDGSGQTAGTVPVLPTPPSATMAYFGPGYRGDFDGDGVVDLIAALYDGAVFDSMRLLRNQGGGSFEDAGPAAPPGEHFYPYEHVPVHGEDNQLVADVDGDGDLDVVSNFAFRRLTAAHVWLNDGSGVFVAGAQLPLENALAAGDFDGDGIRDLFVVSPPDFGSGSGPFYFRKGAADGTYPSTFGFLGSSNPAKRFAIDDIDGDGDLDLLTDDSSTPVLFRNDGAGRFTEQRVLPDEFRMDWAPQALRLAFIRDLNDDGRKDFISYPAKYGGFNTAWVALQNPDGTFRLHAQQMIRPSALIDGDGDGDLDIVGERFVRGTRFHGSSAGARYQFGESTPGTGRAAPTLGATGPFRPGEIAASVITGGLGGTFGVYFVGLDRTELSGFPIAGLTTYTWPVLSAIPIWVNGALAAPGAGSLTLPYGVPVTLANQRLYVQVFLYDPATPGGATQTNGLELVFGN